MAESLTIDFSRPVPLFPLGNCVLLPHATIPLHVFEPRYLRMVSDALDTNGLIAMATFEGEGWKLDYEGKPPIRGHVCVGLILRHERLPDGRYTILLQGICRARVRRELEHDPYRVALLEPTEAEPAMEIDLEDRREHIECLLDDPLMEQLASVKAIRNWMSREIPTPVLIDLSILALVHDTGDRYRMLVETDADARAAFLEHFLETTRKTLRIASRFGSGKSEEGWNLN